MRQGKWRNLKYRGKSIQVLKEFRSTIAENIVLREVIAYNQNTNHIYVFSQFRGNNKIKILTINGEILKKSYKLKSYKKSCAVCGKRTNGIHHILPRACGGESNKENLISLCIKHHDTIEAETDKFIEKGKLIDVDLFRRMIKGGVFC